MAAVSTVGLVCPTLIDILTCLAVLRQHVAHPTVTESVSSVHSTIVTTSSILKRTRVQQFAVLAVFCQLVVRFAPTAEMCGRLLNTVVLTASVTQRTGENGQTGASVHMKPRACVALAVVRASGVDTSVLAASIMNQTLINICRRISHVVVVVSMVTVWPITKSSVITQWIICSNNHINGFHE